MNSASNSRISRGSRLLGGLSGALAHELNQPLTAILSNSQAGQRLLQQVPLNLADLREIFEDIEQADKRAGEVIKRLRALLKKGEAQRHPVEVKDLVREVLELTHADLVTSNVEALTRMQENLPQVMGDRVQLQQVLLNLVVNACDAMGAFAVAPRRLTISATTDELGDGAHIGGRLRCGFGRRRSGTAVRAVLHHQGTRPRSGAVDFALGGRGA